jgi:hypothetical protein
MPAQRKQSRTSRDERRKKRRERLYQPNLGLFLTIKLPGMLIVDTEACVALLRTIIRPLSTGQFESSIYHI